MRAPPRFQGFTEGASYGSRFSCRTGSIDMGVTRHPLFDDGKLPGVPAGRAAIRRVRASLAWLLAQKTDVVGLFYAVLFVRHPALREMFPSDLSDVQCRM